MTFRARLRILAALVAAACSSEPTGGGELLVVSQIEVQPPGATIPVGGTQQLTGTPKTSSGITVPNRPVTWSSDDLGIATVSASGLVTGVSVGAVSITAQVESITEDVTINVTPKPVASVGVEPAQATIPVGGTQQLVATPRDAQGQPLQGRSVTFQSDNAAVASVSTTGLVTAVSTGTTNIRATSEGHTGTSAITVSPRPASRLGFTTQPANGVAGQALAPIRVAVQDEIGGTISDAITTITLSIANNAGGATLSGTITVNAVAGVATFNNVLFDKSGTGYTLRASAIPLSPGVSSPFNIAAGAAERLTMATQPSATAESGAPLGVQPVVRIVDANGNAVSQAGVNISVQVVGTGATLAGDLSVATAANGTATFTDLTLTGNSGSYTLRFLAAGLTEVVSAPITLASVTATGLLLLTQPSNSAQSGVPFTQQPVVQLRDNSNNPVAKAGIPVTVSIAGGGTLLGTAAVETDVAGQAIFTDLGISGTPGIRTLLFTSPGLTTTTSGPITLSAGPASKLGLTTQPSAAAATAVAFAQQPVVQIQDADGNAVAQQGVTVTATVETGSGTLGGTTAVVTNANGQAVYSNLAVNGPAGSYTLRFSASGLTHVISSSITLGSTAPTKLAITTQPSASARNDVAFAVQPVIQVQDAAGNPVATSGIQVTANISSGAGTLGGTVTATTNGSGVATFADLKITGTVGNRTLSFSAPSLTSIASGNVAISAGVATTILMLQQPPASVANGAALSPGPVVDLADVSGNDVDSAGIDIQVAIASGGGTLGGTTTVATGADGRATFGDLIITGPAGNHTLEFTHAGLSSVTSSAINLTAGAATQIAITQQPPGAATVNTPFGAAVELKDSGGNLVSGVDVVATIIQDSGTGTLGGTTTIATVNGVSTFTDLFITLAGTYRIQFTSGALSATSSTIVVSP